jgi:hypothetical protein
MILGGRGWRGEKIGLTHPSAHPGFPLIEVTA